MPSETDHTEKTFTPPYINAHCHIFNVQTMFNLETLRLLADRVWNSDVGRFFCYMFLARCREYIRRDQRVYEDQGQPSLFAVDLGKEPGPDINEADAAHRFLANARAEGLMTDEQWEELAKDFVRRGWPIDKATPDQVLEVLSPQRTMGVLDNYWTLLTTVFDPIPEIAKNQISAKCCGKTGIIVPLCMDITGKGEEAEGQLKRQINATKAAAETHPGRVLPFYGVNTNRDDCLTHFYEEFGKHEARPTPFVGVKIYPSEGYTVYSEDMGRVLKRCNELHLPVTQHANNGGFSKSGKEDLAEPLLWKTRKLLEEFPNIRVNFAHFGGDDFMNDPTQSEWHNQIIALMTEYDRVFTDISYNTKPWGEEWEREAYFKSITAAIDSEATGDSILWGTDNWLLYLSKGEQEYVQEFKKELGPARFQRISVTNPMRFLGMHGTNPYNKAEPNIQRYVDYMCDLQKEGKLTEPPAPWLEAAIAEHP